MTNDVRCNFYRRSPVDVGLWRYDHISLAGPHGDTFLHTPHPPHVGDLIGLYDPFTKKGGVHRVVERSWTHSSWGSADWPYGEPRPHVGPLLDVIVEDAEGPFRDEAPQDDE
jgi:hypothetical protein